MLDLSNMNMIEMDNTTIIELLTQSTDSKAIDLSYNDIHNINIDIIPEQYEDIDLSNNKLTILDISNKKRKNIILKNNSISEITINNVKIDFLDISNNNIRNIVISNSEIENLNLNTNDIEIIRFIDTNIKKLDLSFNNILIFSAYPNSIEELNLSSNKLLRIMKMPDTLIKFELGFNNLTELPNISKNLQSLDISKNKFKDFDISILPNTLTYFDITENNIKDTSIFESLKIHTCLYDTDTSNDSSNSSSRVKYTMKQLKKIEITDDEDEIDEDELIEDYLQTIDDDFTLTYEPVSKSHKIDLMQYIHGENIKKTEQIEPTEDNITRALQEYRGNVSRDIYDFLKDDSDSSVSSEDNDPKYEDYYIRWLITI
jgi:hypothetical protein